MNTKLKGVLQLLVILLVTAAVCVVAYTGIGGAKRGSAKNIRLGLERYIRSDKRKSNCSGNERYCV